jgi:ABC-2 type transport system permease protein
MLTAMVIAREWERGTMEALLSTPITRTELLLSKLLPYYVLGQAALLLCVAFARYLLDVPFRGSLAVLLLVSTFFMGGALGIGLLLSTLTRNQFNAAQAALNTAFLPAMMLSGFVFEITSMPAPVRAISYIVPARYFVSALQTLFQVGAVWSVLWVQMGFLVGASVVSLGLTALRTRRRLE